MITQVTGRISERCDDSIQSINQSANQLINQSIKNIVLANRSMTYEHSEVG